MVTVPVLGTVSSYLLLIFTKSPYLIKVNPVKKKTNLRFDLEI